MLLAVVAALTMLAAAGVPALARLRVSAQPVDVDVPAEIALLTACAAQPGLAAALSQHEELHLDGQPCLTEAAFTSDRTMTWAELVNDTRPIQPTEEQLQQAVHVATVALDRQTYQGHGHLEETGNPDAPLRWVGCSASVLRVLTTVVLVTIPAVTLTPAVNQAAGLFGVLGLVLWLLTGALVAWVDRDTLCIDLPAAAAGYAAAIGCLLVGTGLSTSVIAAAGLAALLTVVLTLFTVVYRRLRGVSGLGAGDLMLLPVLLFVPIALGASWEIAAWGLGAAGVLFVVEAAIVRRRSAVPSAFGPALIVGYALAWVLSSLLT